MSTWRDEALSLDASGDIAAAESLLKAWIEKGNTEALVALANLKWTALAFDEANDLLDAAEQQVSVDDAEAHWALHLAYQLGRGRQSFDERARLAFEHLKIAAMLTKRPDDLLSVAAHYRDGLNTVPRDSREARRWLQLAAATGDSIAVAALRRFDAENDAGSA